MMINYSLGFWLFWSAFFSGFRTVVLLDYYLKSIKDNDRFILYVLLEQSQRLLLKPSVLILKVF